MELVIIGVIGLLVGSFLNVCIYRIPKGESIVVNPSHCVKCHEKIKWYDLVPIISYLMLKGRCRKCGSKISIRYPIIEGINMLTYLCIYLLYSYQTPIEMAKSMFLSSVLIVIGVIDYETSYVYRKTILIGILGGIFFTIIDFENGGWYTLNSIYGALFAGSIVTIIIVLTKGMGWGDLEICMVCGMFLGFRDSVVMLMLAFIIGGVGGIISVISKRRKMKDYISFGPYIAVATIITILFGNDIVRLYLSKL